MRLFVFSLALLLVTGCGSSEPFAMVKFTGKVTYDDGSPIPGDRVQVEFYPQTPPKDARTHALKGVGMLDAEGNFKLVTSHKYGDGVASGPSKVVVRSLDKQEHETKFVPKEFRNAGSTPTTIEIKSGMPPLEIKVPKPKS